MLDLTFSGVTSEMTSWFDRAYQHVSSLSAGPVSLGRRLSIKGASQEVTTFKSMVSDLTKDENPDKCIKFFIKHIGLKSQKEIGDSEISNEISRIIRHIQSNFDFYLINEKKLEKVFSFMNIALCAYTSNSRTDSSLYKILIKILQTNDEGIISSASSVVQHLVKRKELLDSLFVGSRLATIWQNCFIENDIAYLYIAPILNQAVSTYEFPLEKETNETNSKNDDHEISLIEKITPFMEQVTYDFNDGKIEPHALSVSMTFIGNIVKNINTGDFLPNLFPFISEIAPMSESLSFFEPLINCKTSDPPAVWAVLDAICFIPDLRIELLESALSAINNSGIPPDPEVFSFNSFIPKIIIMSDEYQEMLFSVLKKSKIATKADFLCWVMPLSRTSVSTQFLFDLISEIKFGSIIENVIEKFLIEPEIDEIQLCLDSDKNFQNIVVILINQITKDSPNAQLLFERFKLLIDQNDEIATHLLELLLNKVSPASYMDYLIETINNGVSDNILNIYTKIALNNLLFNEIFLDRNGVDSIPAIVESTAGLDFLAALVVDGPYDIVDDFIFENFKETSLMNYSQHSLIDLMMGIPQGSMKKGFLRIPSLCAFVQNIPLLTPYDQYIYATKAIKYFEPTKEQIFKFAVRYMDRDLALKICLDPEYLPILTDPLYPHCIVYQMHPMARCCSVCYQRTKCCSFWFNIAEVNGETVLASFPGGSLDLKANGYITFGNRSLYCSLKQWHLFSFSTIEKNGQKLITGFFDGNKMADVVTTQISTIIIGHDDPHLCNSLWFISPFLHSSSISLDQQEIQKIYENGPHKPTQKLMKASKGVRLVPYRGILRYMHLFGGPFFIFNSMLKAKNSEEFVFYLQSAFNIYNLNIYKTDMFYSAIHYIMRRKLDLFTQQTEQIILNEFNGTNGFNWNGLLSIMGDVVMVSSPYVSCHFLLDILKIHKISEGSIPFFHILLDAFVFIKCDIDTTLNILDICRSFIAFDPTLLKKIAITIVAIPFCDSDNVEVTFTDERFIDKQKMLIDILKEDPRKYLHHFECSEALEFSVKINDELCIDFLEFIASLSILDNNFFDFHYFKKIVPHLYFLVKYEKLWNVLFMLLMNEKTDMIEGYLAFTLERPKIFPIMFDLLTGLLPFEISEGINEGLSFRVLHTLYSLAMTQSLNLFEMIESIQNLCSLGYGERNPYPYPFQLSKRVPLARRASRPRVYRQSFDNSDKEKSHFKHEVLSHMDPVLYEAMQDHMKKHPVSLDQFIDLEIPEAADPENLDKVFSTSIVGFVAMLASKLLVELGKEPSTFKKALGPLLIYGADVLPNVAIEMHKKVTLATIDERIRISNDSMFHLIEFLTNRVLEGWWNGSIIDLFSKMILTINATHKSIPVFIIACMSKIKDPKELKAMTTILLNTNLIFKYCFESLSFKNSFIHLLTTPEVINDRDNGFFILLAEKLNNPDFSSAVKSNSILAFVSHNPNISLSHQDNYKGMVNTATTNSLIITAERLDIARKARNPRLFRFERSNITSITYIRRAFRYEFFLRVNFGITVIEPAITAIFKASILLDKCETPPQKFSIVNSSHPIGVPMKYVPLLFPYDFKFEKVNELFSVPVSKFRNDIDACSPELNLIHFAPKCLEGWSLPGHYTAGITALFKKIFSAVSNPFKCNLLSAPEPLKCVGVLSNDSLHILMNATIAEDKETISLIEKSLVCHYPLFENAIQGLMGRSTLFVGHVVLSIPFQQTTISIPRTYCYKQIAIDIFTSRGCHYTFCCDSTTRKILFTKFKTIHNSSTRRGPGFSQRLLSRPLDVVAKFWATGLMSNFDYLLYLNVMSGRSFNDYSQYPVFPWIISDYLSETDPTSFRDLTKPMGQQTEERSLKYEEMFKESSPHYYYGTHYCYPGAVLYYLVRSEPNTLYNVMLHGGFDHPDRVFLSFEESWISSSKENQADVKEMIPEFYCFPGAVQNVNHYAFPLRTDGSSIENIILPKWAHDDPFIFTYKMRRALECPEVTKMLPNWIDLIFGYKQRGETAEEAKNVFTPLSYDDCVREDKSARDAEDLQISSFGQCPQQLFKMPHVSQNAPKFTYLTDSDIKITHLKKLHPNIRNIRIYDDEIYATPDFCHYVGDGHKLVTIKDGVLDFQGQCQYVEPVFDITSSNVSSDGYYITITTGCGIVLNYWYNLYHDSNLTNNSTHNNSNNNINNTSNNWSNNIISNNNSYSNINISNCFDSNGIFILISRSLKPGVLFKTCALSSHYFLTIAASDSNVYMFDMTSGFLIRELKTKSPVKFIKFNEVSDFIVLCEENVIHVLGLDFSELALYEIYDEITSASTCDSVIWIEFPLFVTGHKSGSVNAWKFDINAKKIIQYPLANPFNNNNNSNPITSLEIFQSYRAAICVDDKGNSALITTDNLQRRVLKTSFFENCPTCDQKLNPSSNHCSICGLPYCKQCFENNQSGKSSSLQTTSFVCKNCNLSFKDAEKYGIISSMSSFKSDDYIIGEEKP
ncbi:Beige/BEACH domain containing protein [Tritrichomonas foetus]|uniref:Beige/BEACH domain containing protein n=1 Tax=Tritrichomonas foetus TaxID=1144522 RepID=A0A1J4K1Y5_9EUKA|nr:Beige/BEACH domain containing protein [Tritrichomonas foetus]|eukprot:OHT04800.1 Beige/BEACH domain containing protein [Tritrichomonas foetus]